MFLCAGARGLHGGLGTQRSVTQWTATAHTHAMHRCFSLHLTFKYAKFVHKYKNRKAQEAEVDVFFTGYVELCICFGMLLNHSQLCLTCATDESKYS